MSDLKSMDLKERLAYLEKANFSKMQALELIRDLGEFHGSVNQMADPDDILERCRQQGEKLIDFKSLGFFLVDEETSDFYLHCWYPESARPETEAELDLLIEDGTFSRAVLEKTPVTAYAENFNDQFLLHVLATTSRVRGMFVGVMEKKLKHVPEACLELFSILMVHCANALESFELYNRLAVSNDRLREKVDQLTASETRLKKEVADHQKTMAAKLLLEGKIWQANKMESIGLLASGTAHDFNNLLSVMTNCTELGLIHAQPGEPVYDDLKRIETATRRAQDLARKLYTIGREDRHETREIDIVGIVDETLDLLRSSLRKSVEISSRIQADRMPVVAEKTRIQQIVINLVTNAAQAVGEGKVTVLGEQVTLGQDQVEAMELPSDKCVRLSVVDTGPGIDPDIIPRVFDPYFSTKDGEKNAGLGLAVVQGIVKNYNGFIEVDSIKGSGTSFHVYLPRAPLN